MIPAGDDEGCWKAKEKAENPILSLSLVMPSVAGTDP